MGYAVFQMMLMYFCSSSFEGIVAGRLPFMPFNFASGMTHRGLSGDDMRDTSLLCIQILATTAFRGYVSKILGNPEGPRMPMEYQTPQWLNEYAKN